MRHLDYRKAVGDLARMVAAMLLGGVSFAVWLYHIGGPEPVWPMLIIGATVGAALAIVSEILSPLFP